MSEPSSPTLRRWLLGQELARLREAAGVSWVVAAGAIDRTTGHIGHIEAGRNAPRMLELVKLLELYGATDTDRVAQFEEWRKDAMQPGWWQTYKLPPGVQVYVGLESAAVRVSCFELEHVPGLLQNADYARAIAGLYGDVDSGTVAARMERQSRVGKTLDVDAVLSEGVLWRTRYMGAAGAAQLGWLQQAVGVAGITLRVLPYKAGAHRAMAGSFSVLRFPVGTLDPVAYQESAPSGQVVDDRRVVGPLEWLFEELKGQALDPEESANVLATFAQEARDG